MNFKILRDTVDNLFKKRGSYISLCQEIAENFYPERADFTVRKDVGDNFADNLMSSFPVQCRRDLGDQIGTMLRPTAKHWFNMITSDGRHEDNTAHRWIDMAEGIMRRAMSDRVALFERATKEADHDFAAFGAACIQVRLNRNANALLYRCHHIRDMVWMEDEEGKIALIARKWKPYAHDLKRMFGSKNHPALNQMCEKDPFGEVECYHIIVSDHLYDDVDARGRPYISIYYDIAHDHKLEELAVWNKEYVIPRWQTVSGSQYPYSPATIVALPDGRLIQAMTYTLMEAGEKIANPPLIAQSDVLKSDAVLFAGGITWVDRDYDERLGASLRPIELDPRGMPIGIDMQRDTRQMLYNAFFLNKLTLPDRGKEMTAYEIGQRVQEYIRAAMPIFAPMEPEYNGAICETSFDILMRHGAFGPVDMIPPVLRGADIQFKFESPLHDTVEQQKGHKLMEAGQLIAAAMQLDQSAMYVFDAKEALRDALTGIGAESTWMRSKEESEMLSDNQQAMQEAASKLAALEQGSGAALNLSKANTELTKAA